MLRFDLDMEKEHENSPVVNYARRRFSTHHDCVVAEKLSRTGGGFAESIYLGNE
jgi:hypothetical protein